MKNDHKKKKRKIRMIAETTYVLWSLFWGQGDAQCLAALKEHEVRISVKKDVKEKSTVKIGVKEQTK